jgi:hypothetical protein
LGTEAIRKMQVEDVPAIVINDIYGNDLYQQGKKRYRKIWQAFTGFPLKEGLKAGFKGALSHKC